MKKAVCWIKNKINDIRRMSQIRLFAIVVMVIVVPISIVTAFSFNLLVNQTRSRYVDSLNMETKQLSNTLGAEMGNLLSVGRMIVADHYIRDTIASYADGMIGFEETVQLLAGSIQEYEDTSFMASSLVSKVAIITNDNQVFGNALIGSMLQQPEFLREIEEMQDKNRNVEWTSDKEIFALNNPGYTDSLYLLLTMRDSSTFQSMATVVIQLQGNVLASRILPSMYNHQTAIVVSHQGKRIVDLDYLNIAERFEEWIPADHIEVQSGYTWEKTVDGAEYVISNYSIRKSDWNILIISNMGSYATLRRMYLQNFILAVGATLILSFFFAFRFSKQFMKPVVDLNNQMKLVKEGDLHVHLDPKSDDEIGQLTLQFNDMVAHIDHLIELNKREQENKRISDIKFLQSQINPHFIYNTLTLLRYSIIIGDKRQADQLIISLNAILRYALSESSQFVTLNRALEWLRNYLVIVNCSLKQPVNVIYDLEEGSGDCMVMRMMIQPLVENAVFHGLKKCEQIPSLKISSRIEDNVLRIVIWDNGPGFDTDRLGSVDPDADRKSIGVENVNQRIRLYYGEDYGVQYRSYKEGVAVGTEAIIRLPVVKKEDGDVLINEYTDS